MRCSRFSRTFAAMNKEIKPVAIFHSPFKSKFGIPRQSGLTDGLQGRISFLPEYKHEEATRGIEGFDHLWLIWGFSANEGTRGRSCEGAALTVRPPRLGGNERIGVFASRSPFRPNGLGLSSVRLIGKDNGELIVAGADLMDGTPIYDIKPYIAYTDSHPEARGGFTDTNQWQRLEVVMNDDDFPTLSNEERKALREALALDPRPRYHNDPNRVYGMPFKDIEVRFRVAGHILTVL